MKNCLIQGLGSKFKAYVLFMSVTGLNLIT
jgi:hypothetical protein